MKTRFILFRRAGVYYCEDTTTGKQSSLRTKNEAEALVVAETGTTSSAFCLSLVRCGVSPAPLALLLYDVSRFSSAIGESAGKDRRFCVNIAQNEESVFADKSGKTLDKR